MNYSKIYNNLIEKSKNRKLTNYFEHHHIIPKCFGGTNNSQNIAILTAREHLIAHILLYKIYKNTNKQKAKKMLFAIFYLLSGNPTQICKLQNISTKKYEHLKINLKKQMSKMMYGKNNHFFNQKHTEKTKEKIRQAKLGKQCGENNPNFGNKWTDEMKKHLSEKRKQWYKDRPNYKINFTESGKQKIRESKLGLNNPNSKTYKLTYQNKTYILHSPINNDLKDFNLTYSMFRKQNSKIRISKKHNAILEIIEKIRNGS